MNNLLEKNPLPNSTLWNFGFAFLCVKLCSDVQQYFIASYVL